MIAQLTSRLLCSLRDLPPIVLFRKNLLYLKGSYPEAGMVKGK